VAGEVLVQMPFADETLGNHAMHGAAGSNRGIGHDAHQAHVRSAVDDGDATPGNCLPQRGGALLVGVAAA
jgi:hypothetical protein